MYAIASERCPVEILLTSATQSIDRVREDLLHLGRRVAELVSSILVDSDAGDGFKDNVALLNKVDTLLG